MAEAWCRFKSGGVVLYLSILFRPKGLIIEVWTLRVAERLFPAGCRGVRYGCDDRRLFAGPM